jgi:phosphoribosyl-ATP pyrophosphohydrolase
MSDILTALDHVLDERKQSSPEVSYVASLHRNGLNKILEKIGEEATEVILSAKDMTQTGASDELVN